MVHYSNLQGRRQGHTSYNNEPWNKDEKFYCRLLKQGEIQQEARCTADSHVNYRYLTTPEKVERMHKLHSAVRVSKHKISDLQEWLDRAIRKDGVRLNECTSNELVSILNKHNQNPASETFSSIFWQQQLKAASTKVE